MNTCVNKTTKLDLSTFFPLVMVKAIDLREMKLQIKTIYRPGEGLVLHGHSSQKHVIVIIVGNGLGDPFSDPIRG